VGRLSTYNIEFKGLSEGQHEFDYQIGRSFFEHFENSLLDDGDVKVKIVLDKHSTFLEVHLSLGGTVVLTCDRCLGPYNQRIKGKASLFVKFGDIESEEGDDVIWLHPDDHLLNVAQLIYEYISVSIPLRHVHPVGKDGKEGCDPEMIKKLEEYSRHDSGSTDDRWSELKKLLNNN
jgi:uncharacterized metal-binding protein YceD (DUF177 family)